MVPDDAARARAGDRPGRVAPVRAEHKAAPTGDEILVQSGRPPRVASVVEEHKSDSLESLSQAIRTGSAEAAAALRSYSDHEWQTITGIHAARGEMDMDFIAQLFIAGHAEEHLHQLDETLAKLGG